MARTNELNKVIMTRLGSMRQRFNLQLDSIAYKHIDTAMMYPHIVFEYSTRTPTDMGREDYTLDFHVWTKNQAQAFDIADAIIDLFSFRNDPQDTILPTFYFESEGEVEDPDKTICHQVVRFTTQNYTR